MGVVVVTVEVVMVAVIHPTTPLLLTHLVTATQIAHTGEKQR